MADFPQDKDPADRYAELERAYTDDRWSDVVRMGDSLVADLRRSSEDRHRELLGRAQLLLGHAHLYGLERASEARPHYQDVLATSQDPDLRQLAEKALHSCDNALAADGLPPPAATGSFLATVAAAQQTKPEGGASPADAASPWLNPATTPPADRLEVEVVEEPELVEVAQADPSLAEELELELSQIRQRRQAAQRQDAAAGAVPTLAGPTGPEAPGPEATRSGMPQENSNQPASVFAPPATPIPKEEPNGMAEPNLLDDPELVGCLLRVRL